MGKRDYTVVALGTKDKIKIIHSLERLCKRKFDLPYYKSTIKNDNYFNKKRPLQEN